MSDADNRQPYQPHPEQGWQPLPQGGEYESEATAFVQLPEGFTTGVYGGGSPRYGTPGAEPLAAPGHGYTPPSSFAPHDPADPGADPASTGQWTMPFADPSAGYADPSAGYPAHAEYAAHHGAAEGYHGDAPEAARSWHADPVDWPVAGSPEAGGHATWSVPAAADDGLEESGEYLLGDDGLTGYPAQTGGHPVHPGHHDPSDRTGHTGHPGHSEHPGHAGHTGAGGAEGYQGGGYPGAYDGAGHTADPGEAAHTGHWNFHGAGTAPAAPQDAPHGGAAHEPFGGASDDPYAHGHGLPEHGAGPDAELPRDGGASGADPYAPGAGAHGAGATGHWSLPADALAQWPPAPEPAPQQPQPHEEAAARQDGVPQHGLPQHQEAADRPDGAADAPDAGAWTVPGAESERPDDSGEFALGDATGPAPSAAPHPEGGPDARPEHGGHDGHTAADGHTAPEGRTAPEGHAAPDGLADPMGAGPAGDGAGTGGHADEDGTGSGSATGSAGDLRSADADGTTGDGTTGGGIPAQGPEGAVGPEGVASPEGVVGHEGTTGPEAPAESAPDATPAPAPSAAAPAPAASPEGDLHAADDPGAEPFDEHPAASYVLRVNGIDRPVTDAWIGESLLYVLRERLGLAGAKDGCSQGECGACSVQVDGRLVASCLVPAATTAGSEVRTVEGLAENGVPSDVQRALTASGAVQCGFCVPGMAMTVHDLLEGNHAPSELETRKALCGNLCRCSGYRGVLDAVGEVVKARAEAAEAAYGPADDTDGAAPADTARIPHQAGPADPTGHTPHDQDPHTGGSA